MPHQMLKSQAAFLLHTTQIQLLIILPSIRPMMQSPEVRFQFELGLEIKDIILFKL